MDAINFDSLAKTSTRIDSQGAEFPVQLQRLKAHLNKAKDGTVFALALYEGEQDGDVRAYCRKSGHVYLGLEHFDDHDVHYVKKRTVECQRCNNIRAALMGIVDIGLLIYTVPAIVGSKPTAVETALFLVAVLTLPSAALHGVRAIKKFWAKANTSHTMNTAQ